MYVMQTNEISSPLDGDRLVTKMRVNEIFPGVLGRLDISCPGLLSICSVFFLVLEKHSCILSKEA